MDKTLRYMEYKEYIRIANPHSILCRILFNGVFYPIDSICAINCDDYDTSYDSSKRDGYNRLMLIDIYFKYKAYIE